MVTLADIVAAQVQFLANSPTCPDCWRQRTECSCVNPNHMEIRKG
ncbi:DUF7419 family protein [Mycobacterium dioxanotrophicus]